MKQLLTLLLTVCGFYFVHAQHTFSIVAVDTETGEVGSAGATCLDESTSPGTGGAVIISRVHPGKGAIHTQAFWHPGNQNNASLQFNSTKSPQEIIDWLVDNDVQGNPAVRQYGIVDFDPDDGSPRVAAHTGVNTNDYKGHIVGPNYAIQGNILIGPEVLEGMEDGFVNTEGSLAVKLMAAMQGANIPGADERCLDEGVSSLSSFIRVAKPDDVGTNFYLNLVVSQTDFGVEPIDVLQEQFSEWQLTVGMEDDASGTLYSKIYPNPLEANSVLEVNLLSGNEAVDFQLFDCTGKVIFNKKNVKGILPLPVEVFSAGLYYYQLSMDKKTIKSGKLVKAE